MRFTGVNLAILMVIVLPAALGAATWAQNPFGGLVYYSSAIGGILGLVARDLVNRRRR